jgi:hypothetical protein
VFEREKSMGKSMKKKKNDDEVNHGSDSSGSKDSELDSKDRSSSAASAD